MATLPGAGLADARDSFTPASSFLELCEYDKKHYTLDITFKTGSVIRHLFVFPATYQTFKESPSHSVFYARALKGRFLTIPLRTHNTGRDVSTALHRKKRKGVLDAGTRKHAGTVERAYAAYADKR